MPARFRASRTKAQVLTARVNTARAQIIDHSALLAAINRGVVRGYGTDVWDPEPPVAGDPLVADERVVITPHVAGYEAVDASTEEPWASLR